jgi:hypothetical protein
MPSKGSDPFSDRLSLPLEAANFSIERRRFDNRPALRCESQNAEASIGDC